MGRDIDLPSPEPSRPPGVADSRHVAIATADRSTRGGSASTTSDAGDLDRQKSQDQRAPRQPQAPGRDITQDITAAQRETLQEIGRFRTVAVNDLTQFHDRGNPAQLRQDLRALVAAGLAQKRTISAGAGRDPLTVMVLTRRGKALSEETQAHASGQRFYAGFVKPAEVAHDAAIYRMYQAESKVSFRLACVSQKQ